MSKKPAYLSPTSSIKEAAKKMAELDCNFIPVGENDHLIGTIADREILLYIPLQKECKRKKSRSDLYARCDESRHRILL
ncbi:CBS domain-containing protein [Coxiella-like endosymbiont]|uniref:CBS domain-containing protein n=1 Tax=Coxiella-like endosymbiont TaxID=1592897 RepID=UPI00272C2256|nr:CBS domain-containing protein [Coxiella-like endosymbiont]